MKNLMILLIVFFVITASSFGQKSETFDNITYQAPYSGQKETGQHSVQPGVQNLKGACSIALYKAIPGTADSNRYNGPKILKPGLKLFAVEEFSI